MHGQCDVRPVDGYISSRRVSPPFDWYQIILLGEQRHVCEQLAQGCYLAVPQLGVDHGTFQSPVRPVTVTMP